MRANAFKEVAISPQSGETGVLCGECKMFVSNNFRKSALCVFGRHLNTTITNNLLYINGYATRRA